VAASQTGKRALPRLRKDNTDREAPNTKKMSNQPPGHGGLNVEVAHQGSVSRRRCKKRGRVPEQTDLPSRKK